MCTPYQVLIISGLNNARMWEREEKSDKLKVQEEYPGLETVTAAEKEG